MAEIRVALGPRSYLVNIGYGNLGKTDFRRFGTKDKISRLIVPPRKAAVITDSNLQGSAYVSGLMASLSRQGIESRLTAFPAGESSKSIETVIAKGAELASEGFDKD